MQIPSQLMTLPNQLTLSRIVAVPAPYETRTKHMPEASGALLTALGDARIKLTRHEVESTSFLCRRK